MAIEKKWPAVAPQLFTADGSSLGVIIVASAAGFKVKQSVVIVAAGQPTINAQVKRVIGPTQIIVGPVLNSTQGSVAGANNLTVRTDLTGYSVANGAYIYAAEQDKVKIKPDDIEQAIYEQEPTVARRVVNVDQYGNFYDQNNPMPIIFDGTVSIGEVEVIGSNGNTLEPNSDGSLNVNIVQAPVTGHTTKSIYNEISSVASGVETQIVSYTVPILKTAVLQRIVTSGENVGQYKVYLNGTAFDLQRTYFGGNFNALFEYISGTTEGYTLMAGDIISVKILHNSTFIGNFNGRIQLLEIT